jgi:hypothetical protein
MAINNLQIGDVVLTGLCYGYTNINNGEQCNLPLMVTEVKNIINDKVSLCKVINMPETYVDINDIHGIPLNQYILDLLGFKVIDKNNALRPAAPNFYGTVYEAQINGVTVQIIKDNNSYELCKGRSTDPIKIDYVHDIQNNTKINGKPLNINYMTFYQDAK